MTSDTFSRTLTLLAALVLSAQAAPPPDEEELRTAPEADRGNAPQEAQLSPPPDSEKVSPSQSVVEIANPAFPGPAPAQPQAEVAPPPPDPGKAYTPAELARYFAEGELAEAKRLFDRGAWLDARRKLESHQDSLPARYLRALAAVRADLHGEAAQEMSALADEYPAMRDRCLTHAGMAFEALKRWDDAARALSQVSEDSRTWSDARLALFRALRNAGKPEEALEAIKPLTELRAPSWGRNVGAEALWAVAELERARKRPDAEREALTKVWALHPLSSLARQAQARLDLKKVSLEREVDRAETLVDAHRNRQGIELLTPLTKKLPLPKEPTDAPSLACRAHFVLGKAFRKEREHSEAIRTLTPMVERCLDPDLRPRGLYVLGSSRSIVAAAQGPGTYETLARDYPAHSFADDALFYAADLYLYNGQVPQALERLAKIGERYPDGDFAAEALFKSFWILRREGQREEALAVLDRIEAIFGNDAESYERERARYWRGRMEEQGGDRAKATEIFRTLATEHPATYYGLISRRKFAELAPDRLSELNAQLVFPPRGDVWPLHAGPLEKDPHFLAGIELYRLGFDEAVTSELLAANRSRAPAEAVRLIVQVLSMAGDARAAHAVARLSLRGDLSGRITERNRGVWEVAYPLAFRNLVEKHCKSARIEPDLLQALMREESALDPKALSWAGALGLTQLMPFTAKEVARRLKIRNVTPQRLLEPSLNIQLGSAYLGDLVKRFDGTYEYALAGYNAGGGAVSKWKRERPTLALDEWVEEIPISETRGYVKRVLRSFNTYRLLYAEPASPGLTQAMAK